MADKESTSRHAFLVGAGILISRLVGLLRQRIFNHYFGLSDQADAFAAALRVPNFLQNLFGEGVLSASFIPVYARLLAEKDDEEADRVAGAIGAILALGSAVVVLAGVIATPYLMWAIAPGYHGAKREMVIHLARILFPGTGLLVCSAWCCAGCAPTTTTRASPHATSTATPSISARPGSAPRASTPGPTCGSSRFRPRSSSCGAARSSPT